MIGAAADLLGWDIRGWFSNLWDTITEISAAYVIAGVALKTVQTTLTAYAWYAILRYAYPTAGFKVVLACYATSVALNGFLPANIGTFVMLLMFTTIIAGATFSGVLGAYVVEKIFFTLIGAFTYLYLFLSVGGSFDIKFAFVHERPWATAILLLGGAFLIYLVIRAFWPKIAHWWDDAKEGGGILERAAQVLHPRLHPVAARLDREPRRDGGLPRRLRHPGQLQHADADRRRQLDRERHLGHSRRRGRQPGVQRRLAEGHHRSDDRHRLLGHAAAGDDRLEHPLRDPARGLGLRLDRRQGARRGAPTPTRRRRPPSRRPPAPSAKRRSGRRSMPSPRA